MASGVSKVAEPSDGTFSAFQDKHPPVPSDFLHLLHLLRHLSPYVSEVEVARAIRSFPLGSLAGPNGLHPQHLKDMLLQSLTIVVCLAAFASLVLEGRTPPSVHHFFFGARLIALDKSGGGVRPIAVGCCLRRLMAKIACYRVMEDMSHLLSPHQLGFSVRGGIEAAIHAACCFINQLSPGEAFVKLDFCNAFNSLR